MRGAVGVKNTDSCWYRRLVMIDFEVGSGGVVTAPSFPVHKPFGGDAKLHKSVGAAAP